MIGKGSLKEREISAAGKNVIVIGGGDTGTDCIATAIRQGAASVTQFQHNKPDPRIRAAHNPWPLFPKIYKQDYGQEKSWEIYGHDPRSFSTATKKFVGDAEGSSQGIAYGGNRVGV